MNIKLPVLTAIAAIMISSASAQNVGIGTTAPLARLHVIDSNVVFSTPGWQPSTPANLFISGPGRRLIWYPAKAAFRVGSVNGDQWDDKNVGVYTHVIGDNSIASWNRAMVFGNSSYATNSRSMAIGNDNKSGGSNSIVMGNGNSTSADYGITLGNNVNVGTAYEIALGAWNKLPTVFTNLWNPLHKLLVVGNGVSENERSDALVILKNGNTGIGVDNPNKRLSVGGAVNIDNGNANTGTIDNTLTFGSNSGEGIGSKRNPGNNQFGLDFYTAGTNRLSITPQGNVGINVLNPANRLSVNGDFNITGNAGIGTTNTNNKYGLAGNIRSLEIQNVNTMVGSTSNLFLTTNSLSGGVGGVTFASPAISSGSKLVAQITGLFETPEEAIIPTGRLYFSTRSDNGINSIKMIIAGNGNVGIGHGDPAFRLDVGARMRIRSTPGFSAGLWLNNDDNTASPGFIGMRQNDEVGFYGQTGSANWRFFVNTTTGNAWLQGTLTQNSDERLKTNIQPLKSSLENLQQLNGYSYYWKDKANDNQMQIGLLAQEVQKAYPQLVYRNEDDVLSVNYIGLVPVLIEALKEQERNIQRLEKMVEQLINKKSSL